MPVLNKSDLNMANSSGTYMNALISDQEDAQAMINAINEFVSSSTEHLKGEAYEKGSTDAYYINGCFWNVGAVCKEHLGIFR